MLYPPSSILAQKSGREDLNLRPPAPKAGALPGCATPRSQRIITTSRTENKTCNKIANMNFEVPAKIRFGDVDKAGIAYYPRIFNMCHVAFEEMWERFIGRSYDRMILEDKIGMPIVHVNADFISPLQYGAEISIRVSVVRIGKSSVEFQFDFFKTTSRNHLARINITNAMVNMESFKSVEIPPKYRTFFEQLRDTAQ